MEPIRAAQEHVPMAAFLTTVGRSSAVKIYTTANDADAPAFPINENRIVRGCKSEISEKYASIWIIFLYAPLYYITVDFSFANLLTVLTFAFLIYLK